MGPRRQRVVYLHDMMKGPAEIYTVRADGGDLKKVTGINDSRLASIRMGDPGFPDSRRAAGLVNHWVPKPANSAADEDEV